MRQRLLFILFACLASAAWGQAPLANVTAWLDRPEKGKQIVSIRMTPTASFRADRVEAVCQYRQAFNWPPNALNPVRRVIEPAIFTYTARQVKFVDSLDLNLNFFVPVDVAELREKHGPTTFTTNAAVTISMVTLTAYTNDVPLWTFKAIPQTNVSDGVLY
jgi:hypothetical protein